MAESEGLAITLREHEKRRTVGPADCERHETWPPASCDPQGDAAALAKLDALALEGGALRHRTQDTRDQIDGQRNFGGPSITQTVVETFTYTWPYVTSGAVIAAGLAHFLNNALGALETWKSLRAGRSITLTYKSRSIELREGEPVSRVLERIEALVADRDPPPAP